MRTFCLDSGRKRQLAREFVELNPRIQIPKVEPRYNIAPTQPVLALHVAGEQVGAREFRWGIELPWARTARQKSQINIRGETALKPGLLRSMLDRQPVLIPASHFLRVAGTCPVTSPCVTSSRSSAVLMEQAANGP